MIHETEVCDLITDIFNDNQGSKVAVYGTGKYAAFLGEHISHLISCFCDGIKVTGMFMNKPIRTILELPDMGISAVIIAANSKNEKIIFERIYPYCKEHGLTLYGIQSGNLMHVGKILQPKGLDGKGKKDALWEAIDAHEVICFDIFDTLFMRCTMYPTDVFDIVEYRADRHGIHLPKGFKNYRVQAQAGCAYPQGGIQGIYQTLKDMLNLTLEETAFLMETELEVEREILRPRKSMIEALDYAKHKGKQVILVSDMYLSSNFLYDLLNDHGINGIHKIYVSDEHGISKSESLFRLVRQENPATSYMHIGDNDVADGWGARKCGIDSFLIDSALGMFQKSGVGQPFNYLRNFNERLLVGIFLEHAYNDPFILDEKGRRIVRDVKDFARLFLAPLAMTFVIWMIHRIHENDYEAVLFASRDGYVFKKMYDTVVKKWHMKDMPRSVYLYASRKMCLGLAMSDMNSLLWMRSKLQGGTRKFVEDVFGIDFSDSSNNDDSEEIWRTIEERQNDIYHISAKNKMRYEKYLTQIGLKMDGCFAFFDMSSQGTSQRALCKNNLINLYGLYMHRYVSKDAETMGRVESFLPQSAGPMYMSNVFEFIFTSPEPSAKKLDENLKVVFDQEVRIQEEIEECMAAQEGVQELFEEILQFGIPQEEIACTVGQHVLDLYKSKAFSGSIDVFIGRAISNDLVGGRLCI